MKTSIRTPGLILLALMGTQAVVAAATLSDVMLDRTWYGDEVTVEDMEGRVVLLEFWGIT